MINGQNAKPKPTKYICHGKKASWNIVLSGVNNTNATSASDARQERFNLPLVNGPILNRDFSERILNA